jgi:hypothetical protein
MRLKMEISYQPEFAQDPEPYIARILEYPALHGCGSSRAEAVRDATTMLERLLAQHGQALGRVQLESAQ